jgi:hypothetical protein
MGGAEARTRSFSVPRRNAKVTHLCSKFNIVCAAYDDGSIACWKYENMAMGWRLMFMEPDCLPTADGLLMSATMTTTGQFTNLYLAVYSRTTSQVCIWDHLHIKKGKKWGLLQLDLKDILYCTFMVNNCYLVAVSTHNSICLFDLRDPPERHKITYMCAPSHAIAAPAHSGPSSPRAPRELSAKSMELNKKERVMCVAVVDPFSFLAFDDGTVCELAQHFNSHTQWEWIVAETWEDVEREVITCLSCVVFTDRHGSNVLLTYGTQSGKVRLCSKVVNTRSFKLIYSAIGHHDQSITQVMISESYKSGGGLVFSSISAGGLIRTWRYLYVDLPQPHVSCISCMMSGDGYHSMGVPVDLRSPFVPTTPPLFLSLSTSALTTSTPTLTHLVFLERNLESNEGKDVEGRVEAHICVLADSDESNCKGLTLFDDTGYICTLRAVDRSSITACCVVSHDDLLPKPYVRNQFITGHENGTLQVWDLDLAFYHTRANAALAGHGGAGGGPGMMPWLLQGQPQSAQYPFKNALK